MDRDGVIFDDNVAAMLKAQGYCINENPRSIYSVDKLFAALEGYAPSKNQNPQPSINYDAGIALAYACFAKPKDEDYLMTLDITPPTIREVTSNRSGSAGLTNYGHTKAESELRALERGLQTVDGRKAPEPCLAFSRTQFNGKTRLVWGYPYSMTVIEGLFAYPLLQRFKGASTPMAFAQTTMVLGTNLRIASYHKEWVYSLDMSQFDATISSQLIRKAFKIISTWFDLNEIEPISGVRYKEIFDLVVDYFIKTPIVMPDGNVYFGKNHGVPSGSYFTQLVDSIVNVIIIGSISEAFSLHASKEDLFVLGDDVLFFSNRRVNLDALADYANKTFGVKMHGSEKSTVTRFDEPIHFLGRVWTNGLPDIDEEAIISRAVFPERFRKRSKEEQQQLREVRLLLLSYAAVYRHGWVIASNALGLTNRNLNRGLGPISIMMKGGTADDVNPDHLSGLLRYQRKYGNKTSGGTDLVSQYWL